ncbi:hypothetical protein CHUAL_003903 [Chamberlinius hualienensis]
MPYLQVCWSPCWCYNNVKHGCIAVAIYTIMFSIVSIVYTAWIMAGGQSSDLYSPFFETDVRNSAIYAGIVTIIFCVIYIGSALLLWRGAIRNVRGLFLPWIFITIFLVLFGTAFGIWFIARYYIDPRSVIAAVFTWLYTGLNIYCLLCVISQYQILKMYQSPNIVVLYP